MSRPIFLKIRSLLCFLLVLVEVHSEKQGEKTCGALDTLMESGNPERIGRCIKNIECTSIVCTAELTQPAPNTAMSVITFEPCSDPVSVHLHVNSSILKGMPLLNDWVSKTKTLQASPPPLGKFNVTLKHQDGGVTFGVVHKSDFDPLPVTLFPKVFIPFSCLGSRKHPVKNVGKNNQNGMRDTKDDTSGFNTDQDLLPPDLGGDKTKKSDDTDLFAPSSTTTVAENGTVGGVANITTTELGQRMSSIHQVLMIMVLLGVVILHLVLAVINVIACVKF